MSGTRTFDLVVAANRLPVDLVVDADGVSGWQRSPGGRFAAATRSNVRVPDMAHPLLPRGSISRLPARPLHGHAYEATRYVFRPTLPCPRKTITAPLQRPLRQHVCVRAGQLP